MHVDLTLPRPHEAQRQILDERGRHNVVMCGRRWGKTLIGQSLVIDAAIRGLPTAWFSPSYPMMTDVWRTIRQTLAPFGKSMEISVADRRIILPGGGIIDFWSLDSANTARGRKYARAVVDEAAYVRDLESAWTRVIRPTLTDLRGDSFFFSTPREAHDYFYGTLFQRGKEKIRGWRSWAMPTETNPFIDPEEIEDARHDMPEAAFRNEYMADPAEASSSPFGWDAIERACCLDAPTLTDVHVWGIDLAKSVDWTVCVGLDRAGDCAAMQRWQSNWRNTTARIKAMTRHRYALIDSTGVGDPIVEQLQTTSPLVEGFTFTSQSRQSLLEGLAVALQCGEIRVPRGPMEAELKSFRHEYSGRRMRYAAPSGMHDDCVMALALAVRARTTRPSPVVFDAGDEPNEWDDDDD